MDEMAPVERGTAAWWNERYQSADIPWDTGIVPPEVEALVAAGVAKPGWALDLGCGSGLSSRYLARHGFRVIGVDLALSALRRGRLAAEAAGVPAHFCLGDVSDLGFLRVRATLALDVGCLHALPALRRPSYIESLARRLVSGAPYLLYTFEPSFPSVAEEPAGLGPHDLAAFAPYFALRSAQHGRERTRPSGWYLFQRH